MLAGSGLARPNEGSAESDQRSSGSQKSYSLWTPCGGGNPGRVGVKDMDKMGEVNRTVNYLFQSRNLDLNLDKP